MRKFFCILLIAVVAGTADAGTVRAMTYNIKHTEAGAATIGDIIHAAGAGIVGLQETTASNAQSIANRLTTLSGQQWYSKAVIGGNDIDAIVTRYPILSSTHITMYSAGDAYDAIRSALQVTVDTGGGQQLQFVTTHLSTYGGLVGQGKQVRELIDFCHAFRGPLILTGDLNLDGETYSDARRTHYNQLISSTDGKFTDSYRERHPTEPLSQGYTQVTSTVARRYDYVLYTKSAGFNAVASNRIVNSASDHYPVWTDFDWNGASFTQPSETLGSGSIQRELYSGISGTSVSSLIGSANFPNNPSSVTSLTAYLQPAWNTGDNYGQRVRGWITAPQTGSYTFYLAGNDNCELWLSTTPDTESGKQKIAWIGGTDYTLSAHWSASQAADTMPAEKGPKRWIITTSSRQVSAALSLTAGRKYYIEVLHKEGTGQDYVAVGWKLPSGLYERPIPAKRLSPYSGGSSNTPPSLTLTSPMHPSTYTAPATIELRTLVSDSNLAGVRFYSNGVLVKDDVTTPYSHNILNVQAGTYTIRADAYDTLNAMTTKTATVTVVNGTAPSLTLTSPADGAIFTAPATIELRTTVSDSNGIKEVNFYSNGSIVKNDLTDPYSHNILNVGPGTYTIWAAAKDLQGAVTNKYATVTVNAAALMSGGEPAASSNTPPVISSSASATPNPANVGQAVSFFAAAGDADGDVLSYAWSFGDGATASGSSVAYAYSKAGNHTATVNVSDGKDGTAASSVTVVVNAPEPGVTVDVAGQAGGGPSNNDVTDLGTFKLGNKVRINLPAPTANKMKIKAVDRAELPPGLKVSGKRLGGVCRAAGEYMFSLSFRTLDGETLKTFRLTVTE